VGGLFPDFPKNYYKNFFTNTSFTGLNPLFTLSKCHIWGDTEGGRGPLCHIPTHQGGSLCHMTICQLITFWYGHINQTMSRLYWNRVPGYYVSPNHRDQSHHHLLVHLDIGDQHLLDNTNQHHRLESRFYKPSHPF